MSKKVLSFDVGIINLAYCLFEINTEEQTFKILKWGIINLADHRLVCQHVKRNKEICGKIAKNVLNVSTNHDPDNNHYYCKEHASKGGTNICVDTINLVWGLDPGNKCDMCDKKSEYTSDIINGKYCSKHKKTITSSNNYVCATKKCSNIVTKGIYSDDKQKLNIGWCDDHFDNDFNDYIKKKTKKISQNSNKISLVALGKSMYHKLDQIPDFLVVDDVFVENQPTFMNPTMKSVSAILFSYFIMRGIHEKERTGSTISNISFCSPSNKIKVGGKKASDMIDKAANNEVYDITKDLGVQCCKALISDNQTYLDILNSHKKQDDMCDAFLQGFIMYFGSNMPTHYLDKIKTLDFSKKKVKKTKKESIPSSSSNPELNENIDSSEKKVKKVKRVKRVKKTEKELKPKPSPELNVN